MNRTLNPAPSPCVRNCCLDNDDICLGCFRSLEEIISWTQVDEKIRQHYLDMAQSRREAYILKYHQP